MRGKDRLSGKSGQPDRITPACAEKRPARPGYAYNRGDHPRMCGKKFLEVVQPIAQWGSPPRMRGKGLQGHQARCRRGITPAYAGKSDLTSGTQTLLQGSPPHMRGKGLVCLERDIRVGITPACAGKSVSWYVMTSSTWDHPRMCGEKRSGRARSCACRGSPPRMRGKGLCNPQGVSVTRITPACAGKSCVVSGRTSQSWDHPRMCGEKTLGGMESHPARGSPPHVRGKVKQLCVLIALRGITPACAGKSRSA